MNGQEVKEKATRAAKEVVDGEIEKLKKWVIDQLEEKGKSVLNESLAVWADRITAVFLKEGGIEQGEIDKAISLAKDQMEKSIKGLIEVIQAFRPIKEVWVGGRRY